MIGDVVIVADDGRLAVLGSRTAVEVEAIQPDSCSIELFTSVHFVLRFGGNWKVEI